MKQTKRCPKCGSTDIIPDAEVRNHEGPVKAVVYRNPHAVMFRGRLSTPLMAWVCAGCSFVEFYAANAADLKPAAGS